MLQSTHSHQHQRPSIEPVVPHEIEQHYTPKEVAQVLKISPSQVIKIFRDHPRVLKFSSPATRLRRTRRELRIPASAIHEEITKRCR